MAVHLRRHSVCLSIGLGGLTLKYLMRSNLALGLWLMVSPFVLMLVNPGAFQLLWEDFILGLGIATFSLCRLSSRRVAALADGLVGALGLITLINPILYHYFNAKVAAGTTWRWGLWFLFWPFIRIERIPNRQKRHEGPAMLSGCRPRTLLSATDC